MPYQTLSLVVIFCTTRFGTYVQVHVVWMLNVSLCVSCIVINMNIFPRLILRSFFFADAFCLCICYITLNHNFEPTEYNGLLVKDINL